MKSKTTTFTIHANLDPQIPESFVETFLADLCQLDGVTGSRVQPLGPSSVFLIDARFDTTTSARAIHSAIMKKFLASKPVTVTGIETVLTDIFR